MTSIKSVTVPNERFSNTASPDLIVVGHANFTAINRNVYVRLQDLGWTIELAIPRSVPYFSRTADPERAGDPPIHWVEIKGNNQRFWHFNGVEAILQSRQPRAILVESDPASVLAIKLAGWTRKRSIPLLCYTNENTVLPPGKAVRAADWRAVARTLRSLVLARMSRSEITQVFVLCNAAAESMKVLGFADRISYMPLGFDPAVFHVDRAARETIRASRKLDAPVIAYIGRVAEGKGLEFLIEALGQIGDLNWHFLIDNFKSTRPGDYADKIERLLANDPVVAARCQRFHADHYEIAKYMNAADIVVAPSCLPEQYGRVLAEAMACGKVVVASDAGAYPELVRDGGIIVPSGRADALAAELRGAIENPALSAKLAGKALIRARALTIGVQAEIIARELKRALMKRGEPACETPGSMRN